MPASIFNGTAVKILKNILRTKALTELITGDTDNPTVVAKNAPASSIYLRSGTGEMYIKTDSGSSTNWNLISTSSTAANRTLSNLTSPTAINQSLQFGSADTLSVGDSTNRPAIVHSDEFRLYNNSSSVSSAFTANQTLPAGVPGDGIHTIVPLRRFGVYTVSDSSADALATADLYLQSGNKTAGTGNSGNIINQPGTSAGGSRGNFIIRDGSEGTAGHVWTSTNTTGSGGWAAASSGANTTLSNLTSPTAVNQDLLLAAGKTLRLANNTNLIARNNSNTADISMFRVTGLANRLELMNTLEPTGTGGTLSLGSLTRYFSQLYISQLRSSTGGSIEVFPESNLFNVKSGANSIAPTVTLYDNTTTFFTGIKSAGILSASYTLTLPVDAGTSGQALTTNGTGTLSWTTISSGANTALSNLASTAINTALNPGTTNSVNIGLQTLAYNFMSSRQYNAIDTSTNNIAGRFIGTTGTTTPSTTSVVAALFSEYVAALDKSLGVYTNSNNTADAVATGSLLLETGNKTAGTGNSGDIVSRPGTSSGGTRGKIIFKDGSEGTAGHVWTSTDTTGKGAWVAASGGANTTLSNLTSTSVNADIVPDTDNTRKLGSSANNFNNIYTKDLNSSTSIRVSSDTGDAQLNGGSSVTITSNSADVSISSGAAISLESFTEVTIAGAPKLTVPTTVTAGGTTGNQTINKMSGTVNFAASASSLTVTCSKCSASSIVFAVVRTNDTTATIKNVVPASGSFVINLGVAATAETSVGFWVIN